MSTKQGIEIQENRPFQERFWRAERIAWIGFAVFILTGALGFLGAGGLFARSTVMVGDSLVDYPRVARWQTPERMVLTLAPRPASERSVLLGRRFGEQFALEGMEPTIVRAEIGEAGKLLTFAAKPGEQGEATVRFKPDRPGIARVPLSIDGSTAAITIIVLP